MDSAEGADVAYTVSKVRNSRPGGLAITARDAEASAQRVNAQIAQGGQQMNALHEGWGGTASDAASKQWGELASRQTAYSLQLSAVQKVLKDSGPKLVGYRSDLDDTVNDAEGKFDVADDGSVSLGSMLTWFVRICPFEYFAVEATRIRIECRIKLLLAQFEAADLAAGYAIRQACRELT